VRGRRKALRAAVDVSEPRHRRRTALPLHLHTAGLEHTLLLPSAYAWPQHLRAVRPPRVALNAKGGNAPNLLLETAHATCQRSPVTWHKKRTCCRAAPWGSPSWARTWPRGRSRGFGVARYYQRAAQALPIPVALLVALALLLAQLRART